MKDDPNIFAFLLPLSISVKVSPPLFSFKYLTNKIYWTLLTWVFVFYGRRDHPFYLSSEIIPILEINWYLNINKSFSNFHVLYTYLKPCRFMIFTVTEREQGSLLPFKCMFTIVNPVCCIRGWGNNTFYTLSTVYNSSKHFDN